MKEPQSTRGLARQAVRQQIATIALARFREQGFQETTVDQIASDVGMSTRTFFRYFRSKDDVILDPTREFTHRFLSALERSLATADIWTALEHALKDGIGDFCDVGRGDFGMQDLIQRDPALAARQVEIMERLQADVTDLCGRLRPLKDGLDPLTLAAVVGSAFACLRVVQQRTAPAETPQAALSTLMQAMKPAALLA